MDDNHMKISGHVGPQSTEKLISFLKQGKDGSNLLAKHLRLSGYLGPLSIEQLNRLLKESEMINAGAGEIILNENDSLRDHIILLTGKLEAQRVWFVDSSVLITSASPLSIK